jgi:hypothetical protein
MSLQLHRPDGQGGLEKRPPEEGDWRQQLRTPRWGAGLRKRRPPRLANPEMNPTSNVVAVAFWVFLALVTFVILVVGYGSGFWQLG